MIRLPHETKKCFPTKCRKCNADVLYWESTSGAKVFLNLPIYGKPIHHICKKNQAKKRFVIETFQEHLKKRQERAITYQCPVCNKIFRKELQLNQHIKKLKNYDDSHAQFFEQIMDFIDISADETESTLISPQKSYQTPHQLKYMNDRFILKTKDPKDKKKFEKLYKR